MTAKPYMLLKVNNVLISSFIDKITWGRKDHGSKVINPDNSENPLDDIFPEPSMAQLISAIKTENIDVVYIYSSKGNSNKVQKWLHNNGLPFSDVINTEEVEAYIKKRKSIPFLYVCADQDELPNMLIGSNINVLKYWKRKKKSHLKNKQKSKIPGVPFGTVIVMIGPDIDLHIAWAKNHYAGNYPIITPSDLTKFVSNRRARSNKRLSELQTAEVAIGYATAGLNVVVATTCLSKEFRKTFYDSTVSCHIVCVDRSLEAKLKGVKNGSNEYIKIVSKHEGAVKAFRQIMVNRENNGQYEIDVPYAIKAEYIRIFGDDLVKDSEQDIQGGLIEEILDPAPIIPEDGFVIEDDEDERGMWG